jgi:hypothetical protein
MSGMDTKDRALLVFCFLFSPEENKGAWRTIYEAAEVTSPRIANLYLSSHYREVRNVVGAQSATEERLVSELDGLTQNNANRAVDLFLQLHGGPKGEMYFAQRRIVAAVDVAEKIRQRLGHRTMKLRLAYNTSCWGNLQSPALLEAGFATSIGSVGINANGGTEFPDFCQHWPKGWSIERLIREADGPARRAIQDGAARLGFRASGAPALAQDVDSRKVISGNINLTISTLPFDEGEMVELRGDVITHRARQSSTVSQIHNNRSLPEGCVVRQVGLERLNSRGEVIDGPLLRINAAALGRAGAYISEHGVGTNSLRVVVRSWNGMVSENLNLRIVYRVEKPAGRDLKVALDPAEAIG